MKRIPLITVFLTTFVFAHAHTLYAPLEQFAGTCVLTKQAMMVQEPDYDQQFEQVYSYLKIFTGLPLVNGPGILHPSRSCTEEARSKHITFSPTYLVDYLNGNIPNPYTHSFPYAFNQPVRPADTGYIVRDGEADTVSIYYVNSVLCPNGEEQFEYTVSAGEQQMVLIAEDDTPLEIEMSSEAGTAVLRTDMPQGYAQRIWSEMEPNTVHVVVKNPSDLPVSFVIAVH